MTHILEIIYGMIFGIANIIPGVSGGTMMVVFGVYDKLIDALSFKISAIKKNIVFLLFFGVGAAVGIIAFSFVITWLFADHPVPANMFFMGLIAGSIPLIIKTATKKDRFRPICLAAFIPALVMVVALSAAQGTAEKQPYSVLASSENGTYKVTLVNDSDRVINKWTLEVENGSLFAEDFKAEGAQVVCEKKLTDSVKAIFTGEPVLSKKAVIIGSFPKGEYTFYYNGEADIGVIDSVNVSYSMDAAFFLRIMLAALVAAIAMIIPGVSGSFIMVLLGVYTTVIGAIKNLEIITLIPVAIGVVIGVVFGAKLISSLLKRYSLMVYSAILGLVIGSLYAVFPEGIGLDGETFIGVVALAAGVVIAVFTGKLTKKEAM